MACDTFLKIAQKCRRHFVLQQSGEVEPFIDEILRKLSVITYDLAPSQVQTFYEACGCMIASQPNRQAQERLIANLMELPNQAVSLCSSTTREAQLNTLSVGWHRRASRSQRRYFERPRDREKHLKCPEIERQRLHIYRAFLPAANHTHLHGFTLTLQIDERCHQ